jgi:transposase-like protein
LGILASLPWRRTWIAAPPGLIPALADSGLQQLIKLEASAVDGSDRHERSRDNRDYPSGYLSRRLTTQVADIDLLIR